jgi:hypothetical protein
VMNLADWAASVGVNRHTAYRWFRQGTLPAERVGAADLGQDRRGVVIGWWRGGVRAGVQP